MNPADYARMSWHARQKYNERMRQAAAARAEKANQERALAPRPDYGAVIRDRAQAFLDRMDRTPADIAAAHLTELWLAVGGTDPKGHAA